jgi:hypothetical protein
VQTHKLLVDEHCYIVHRISIMPSPLTKTLHSSSRAEMSPRQSSCTLGSIQPPKIKASPFRTHAPVA